MNTFANHGFLPRSGKYITEQNMIDGLFDAVHFDRNLSQMMFDFALRTNPEPNSTRFSLDHLARHNMLEHDASLSFQSRVNAYFGHAEVCDEETFDQARSYWGDTINAHNGVDAMMAHINTSNKTNPEFNLSTLGESFLIGDIGAFITVLGNNTAGTANKSVVEYLFGNERLPTDLSWKRRDEPLNKEQMMGSMEKIREIFDRRLNGTAEKREKQPLALTDMAEYSYHR